MSVPATRLPLECVPLRHATTPETTCAAPGCDQPGPSGHGPPSPVLLSSLPHHAHRASQRDKAEPVSVEVDMGSASSRGRPIDQAWMIRLRRGRRSVIIAIGLRRPAADRLAAQVADLLGCEH